MYWPLSHTRLHSHTPPQVRVKAETASTLKRTCVLNPPPRASRLGLVVPSPLPVRSVQLGRDPEDPLLPGGRIRFCRFAPVVMDPHTANYTQQYTSGSGWRTTSCRNGTRRPQPSKSILTSVLHSTTQYYTTSTRSKMGLLMMMMMAHQNHLREGRSCGIRDILDFSVWKTPNREKSPPPTVFLLLLWFSRSNGNGQIGKQERPSPPTTRDGALRPGRETGGHRRVTFILDGASRITHHLQGTRVGLQGACVASSTRTKETKTTSTT